MEWYPRYPSLWRAKTMHLNPYQEGCYLRLVDHYMETRQALPTSDAALSRIIGISPDDWIANAADVVRAFFKQKDGLLFHDRCDQILNDQDERTRKHTEKGKKGAAARWREIKELHATAMPQAMPADATRQDMTGQDRKAHTPAPDLKMLPDGWNPTIDQENRCRSLGYDPAATADAFKNNHRAKGHQFADWDAAFETWIAKEANFRKQPKGESHGRQRQTGGQVARDIARRILEDASGVET